jgi:hypothetical protein
VLASTELTEIEKNRFQSLAQRRERTDAPSKAVGKAEELQRFSRYVPDIMNAMKDAFADTRYPDQINPNILKSKYDLNLLLGLSNSLGELAFMIYEPKSWYELRGHKILENGTKDAHLFYELNPGVENCDWFLSLDKNHYRKVS